MTFKTKIAAGGAAAIAFAAATAAFAQAPAAPAAPAASQVIGGPPIQGVCIFAPDGAVAGSTVGKFVGTRMQQLVAQTNAELSTEQNAIETEGKQLEAQRASLDATTLEQRGSQLQVRANAWRRKAELRDRELQATQQKAVARIGQEMEPIVRQIYTTKNCGLLLHRDAVVLGNPAMDITPAVITGLNAKITQFAFDREHLDQAAATAAAGAPPVQTVPGASAPAARPAPTRK
jgi:outer membrane protein